MASLCNPTFHDNYLPLNNGGGRNPLYTTDANNIQDNYLIPLNNGGGGVTWAYENNDDISLESIWNDVEGSAGYGGENQAHPAAVNSGVQVVGGNQLYPAVPYFGGGGQNQAYSAADSISFYGGGVQLVDDGDQQSCPTTFSSGNNDISLASICNDDVHLHDDVSAGHGGENQAADSGGNICSGVEVVDGEASEKEMEAILGNMFEEVEKEMEAILGNMYDQFHLNHLPTTGGGEGAAAGIHAKMYEELYRNQYPLPAAVSDDGCVWAWTPGVGCRFQPSDEELITEFLVPELIGSTTPASASASASRVMMRHADIYDHHPSQLQQLAIHYHYCDSKMYFFTPIDKIGNIRTHRSIKSNHGFWKATQKAKDIHDQSGNLIGSKTPLTYVHNTQDHDKTKWLMSEYKLPQHSHHLVLAVVYRKRDNNNDN